MNYNTDNEEEEERKGKMSENEELGENSEYDQPWNPVSYFEEENEATGW